ncbi:hypothetical protein BJV82DRAFT_607900 [Fennellomyces sp. T-0311]|nr:hypothetical protein BJV82DRAFT_607900 [Fennellomyces sp. T-0311]
MQSVVNSSPYSLRPLFLSSFQLLPIPTMRILLLSILIACMAFVCLANAQIDKKGLDEVVDLTDVRMDHYGTDHTPDEQQPVLWLPSTPPTFKDRVIARLVEWQAVVADFLERHFPRQIELIRHISALSLQAKKENQELGHRAIVLTWDDIHNDMRRMFSIPPFPVKSDSITRRRALAGIIKSLSPPSVQQDAFVMQNRLLHWTSEAAEQTTAATNQLAQHYYSSLSQLSQQFTSKRNETLTEPVVDELNTMLMQIWNDGLQLTKDLRRLVDTEFAKLVWLSGAMRPWLEEINTASLDKVTEAHKDAMYSTVSRVRNVIINSITTGPQEMTDASTAIVTSKIRAERAFADAEKKLKKVWENAASEIRASPWTTPYWEDVVKDTVVATKSQVLGVKEVVQDILARLAGCNCRP